MPPKELQSGFNLPILVSKHSNRQNYVFDLIFKQLLGINYHYIDTVSAEKVFSYGYYGCDFFQQSHGLLYQEGITEQVLDYVCYKDKEFPFRVEESGSLFPFDLFSVVFYCVTRYEEYGSRDLDRHGRYKPENSWVYKKDLFKIPVVNYLVSELKVKLEDYFNITLTDQGKYKIELTIDIDNAYAYHNSFKSVYARLFKSLLKLNFEEYRIKKSAIEDRSLDPFNTHRQIIELSKDYHSKVFILMASGGLNSTNNVHSTAQKEVINLYENSHYEIGLHPSYKVLLEQSLEEEFNNLSHEVSQVRSSRFHYIKNLLPISYYELIKVGIKTDYSMGYATDTGFRAGICCPYKWYDLIQDAEAPLEIHPFYFMDAAYIFNLQLDLEDSLTEIALITSEIKKYMGVNSFVFHNESLSNYGIYKGWGDFFKKTLGLVK